MQKCYVVCFAKENVQMLFCTTCFLQNKQHYTTFYQTKCQFALFFLLEERHSCKATMHFAMQNAPILNYKNIKNKEHFST